jgi:hypothetical protein
MSSNCGLPQRAASTMIDRDRIEACPCSSRVIHLAYCVLLWLSMALAVSTDSAGALSLDNAVGSNIARTWVSCLRWCRGVEQARKLDELSVVKESNCRFVLRKSESGALKTVACNQSACIYRLGSSGHFRRPRR